jgi:hypothetical protein
VIVPVQYLVLELDGITAGDYLTWVRDPEPPALGFLLDSITVRADPLGETIQATLAWNRPPPSPRRAALLAGFPLTPEVRAVEARTLAAAA